MTVALAVPLTRLSTIGDRASLRQELGTVCHQKWRLHSVCEHSRLNSTVFRLFPTADSKLTAVPLAFFTLNGIVLYWESWLTAKSLLYFDGSLSHVCRSLDTQRWLRPPMIANSELKLFARWQYSTQHTAAWILSGCQTIDKVGQLLWAWFRCSRENRPMKSLNHDTRPILSFATLYDIS